MKQQPNPDTHTRTPRSKFAVVEREGSLATGELTCIDRHEGTAHQLPDMIEVPETGHPYVNRTRKRTN